MMPQSPAIAQAAQPSSARQSDIVVGIPAGTGSVLEGQIAMQVVSELSRHFPSHPAAVFFLTRRGLGEVEAIPVEAGQPVGPALDINASPSPVSGGFLGSKSALPALLRQADRMKAPLCALVAPQLHDDTAEWMRLLLQPILEGEYDFVCPSYRRGKLEGTINSGIVYPLTRALYGRRLRQPLGGELALSRKLASALLEDEEWQSDPMHAGADIWLITKVLSTEFRVCQAFLGKAPETPERTDDLSGTLSRVLGLLFHEMERHAATWQRINGSELVPTVGQTAALDGESRAVNVSRMLDAFELGCRDLRTLWSILLPPATMLALKRMTLQGATSFRFADELWARVVYDFALGYHMRLMDRTQLLRSMMPLYLGWLAGFVNEVSNLDGIGAEERIERLCCVFESSKPYLISRWRWPDRFNP